MNIRPGWLTHITLAPGFPGSGGQLSLSVHPAAQATDPICFCEMMIECLMTTPGGAMITEPKQGEKTFANHVGSSRKLVVGWSKKFSF